MVRYKGIIKYLMLCFLLIFFVTVSAGCGLKKDEALTDKVQVAYPEHRAGKAEEKEENIHLDIDMTISEKNIGKLVINDVSSKYDGKLAEDLLVLCSGHKKDKTAAILNDNGFEVIAQYNYDKEDSDASHTCAYTFAYGSADTYLGERPVLLVVIRGTNASEWYSNFDFCPEHKNGTIFSENFMFAASDIFIKLIEICGQYSDKQPMIVICGHSRGAAVANILGVMMNSVYPEEMVMTYTYATPNTVLKDKKTEYESIGYPMDNIFNVISPLDAVVSLPLEAWGYTRFGTDIFLVMNDDEKSYADKKESKIRILSEVAPKIESYYGERHALDREGLSEDGITSYDLMMLVSEMLSKSMENDEKDEDVSHKDTMVNTKKITETVAEESDIYPLVEIMKELINDNGKELNNLLRYHLPSTYYEMMTDRQGK